MSESARRWRAAVRAVVALAIFASVSVSAAQDGSLDLDLDRLRWSKLQFEARKFFLEAAAEIEVAECSRQAPSEPASPACLNVVHVNSRFLGRRSEETVFLGRGLETTFVETFESRGKGRHKQIEYQTGRIVSKTFATESQKGEDLRQWPWVQTGESTLLVTPEGAMGTADPTALLVLLSASDLSSPGDVLRVPVVVRDQLVIAVFRAQETTQIRANFYDGVAKAERRGLCSVLHVALSSENPSDASADPVEAQLLGLTGESIDIFLDPESRAPIEVRGRISGAGQVRIRLRHLEATS